MVVDKVEDLTPADGSYDKVRKVTYTNYDAPEDSDGPKFTELKGTVIYREKGTTTSTTETEAMEYEIDVEYKLNGVKKSLKVDMKQAVAEDVATEKVTITIEIAEAKLNGKKLDAEKLANLMLDFSSMMY